MILHAKYLSSSYSGSGEEDFLSFPIQILCKTYQPPRRGLLDPGGHDLKYFGSGPLGDATCQISKL